MPPYFLTADIFWLNKKFVGLIFRVATVVQYSWFDQFWPILTSSDQSWCIMTNCYPSCSYAIHLLLFYLEILFLSPFSICDRPLCNGGLSCLFNEDRRECACMQIHTFKWILLLFFFTQARIFFSSKGIHFGIKVFSRM